jgi:Ca-activated chloride channel homolog
MKYRLLFFSIFAALMAIGPKIPQGFSQESKPPLIRAEVSLVNVVFTVTDRQGRSIDGLKESDFQIFEDKQPQKIDFFSYLGKGSDVPLTIALLIDTSASVKDKLDFEKQTAAEFFKEILRANKDLALIINFDSEVNLIQDFTQDVKTLTRALQGLDAANDTSLYDAVYLAAQEKLSKEIGRKVMVVITDGDDTGSKVKKAEAIEAAQRNDIIIYGIGVQTKGTDFGVLKEFAKQTGGAFFLPHSSFSEIQAAFQSIRREIQGQYSLGYISSNKNKDGSYRAIDLRSKVSGLRIRARKGYYAPKATN